MMDGGNFNASDAVIALGVGKNMVSSIRYWLKVFGLSEQDKSTDIADYLFDEAKGVDKYIESLGTLWLLHYLLVSQKEATLYHITFVQFQKERKSFDREQLVNFVKRLMQSIREKRNVSGEVSLLDFNSFLRKNYTNTNRRFLRYLFSRVEKFICEHTNQNMQNDIYYISTKTGNKTGYHIEHILSENEKNRGYFKDVEEFEDQRNLLGGLLLLKGLDNISSGNEEYSDKLKTYSNGLVWGHSLCEDYYHANKDFDKFNKELSDKCNVGFKAYRVFDQNALMERSRLLYEIVKVIWEVS